MIQRIVRECELSQINGKPLHNQYVDFDDKECLFCHAFNVAYQRGKTETEKRVREVVTQLESSASEAWWRAAQMVKQALDGEQG